MAAKKPAETRAEQEKAEYSTYRAVAPIIPPGYDVVGFLPGHIVPVSHVEQYGYHEQGLVEKLSGEEKAQAEQTSPFVAEGPIPQPE